MKKSLVLALALASTLTACGGDNGKDQVGQASQTPTPTATAGTSACSATPTTTDMATKPAASVPAGSSAPAKTTFTDVVIGKGPEAKAGSSVAVKYVGVLFDSCKEFDSSWSRGPEDTLPFSVGGGVITGFSTGVTGMKVGGRRQVIIPPADGYGDQDNGPIPGGSTLIFVIDLVSVS